MIRVKLESIEDDENGTVRCSVKNRDYENTYRFIDEAILGCVTYEMHDTLGNKIDGVPRHPKKEPKFSHIEIEPNQYGTVDHWHFNMERYIGHTPTMYWPLEEHRGKTVVLKATYKVTERLASEIFDRFNVDGILVAEETSKELEIQLP